MIERDLGIDGPAAPAERRLRSACALVHALIARPASDRPADRAEALALFEELTLPAAVFDGDHAPRLANGAWRALFGARGGAFPGAYLDEVLRDGAMIHLADLALELEGCSARCAATLRPILDDAGATTGAIVLCMLIADQVVARELGVGSDALVWGGPVFGDPDYFNGAWGAYTRDARRFARLYAWKSAIHIDDRPSCVQAFDDAVERGRASDLEARVLRADGSYRWHRIRFVIIAGSRWYAVATDIQDAHAEAERADLRSLARAARDDAEHANRLKKRLLAACSDALR